MLWNIQTKPLLALHVWWNDGCGFCHTSLWFNYNLQFSSKYLAIFYAAYETKKAGFWVLFLNCFYICVSLSFFLIQGLIFPEMKTAARAELNNYNQTNHSTSTVGWDTFHKTLGCCGVESYTDWFGTNFYKKTGE